MALLPDLRRFARFLAGQHADADDLLQETVVRALAALSQYEPGTDMRAWTFTILRNAFYEQLRRRKTEARALAESSDLEEARPPAQVAQMDFTDLQRALFALSPLLREALILVGAHGLSYEEAGRICGVPEGTIKARVSRARRQLAQVIRDTPAAVAPQ
jgi:RNA polymerase sigma-70 factor (ECF subfamily)